MTVRKRAIAGCTAFVVMMGTLGRGGEAWFQGRDYRQRITVDQNLVIGSGVHTNFPVLVTAGNVGTALWQHAQNNGADIVFTAADGTTRLPHEIERYDAATSNLWAWVKVPELAGEANTSFYMYYGQPTATDVPAGAAVWSGYRAVWHLKEAASTRYDSTTNGAHAATYGGISSVSGGKIDGACGFDGVNGFLRATKQVVNSNGTITAWVKMPNPLSGALRVIFDTHYDSGVLLRETGDKMEVFVKNGSAVITSSSYFQNTAGTWVYVTLTLNDGAVSLYRNGQFLTSASYAGRTPVGPNWAQIGAWDSGAYWSGAMDEVRVCRQVRSPDWIATEYANQNAPGSFASAAAEEQAPASNMPWYSGWGYRQLLFVAPAQVSGSLSNFPTLVTERNMRSNLWMNATSDGSDILFTAADGVTKLAHELEKFDSAGKQLCAWVKLPLVSATSNTSFFVYYGRPSAANQEDPAGVWTRYRAVWHLRETSGVRFDSTSNDADVAPNGGVSHTANGRVDGACSFDGSTGYLSANKQVINGNATVSAWVKMPATLSTSRAIFDTGYNAGTLIRQYGAASGERLEAWINSGSAANIVDSTYFQGTENSWVYLTLVMSNNTAYLYRNGQYRMNGIYSGTPLSTFVNIGLWPGGPQYWNSLIDETRVALGVLSADRIATEYRNQATPSTFVFASAEEIFMPQGTLMLLR